MENKEFLKRWRLILGSDAEQQINNMGGAGLSAEELLMDSALSQIYGNDGVSGAGVNSEIFKFRGAGKCVYHRALKLQLSIVL